MRRRPILPQQDGVGRAFQHTREEGQGRCRGETAFLPLIKEAPSAVIDQAQDLVALPLA
jgi:hypothetical protein